VRAPRTPPPDEAALRAALDRGLAAGACDLDERARATLVHYVALLARWNRVYNLTSVRDPLEMVVRHVLDSLSILPWVCGPRLTDLGTGAGLPGLVLAVANPDIDCELVDSVGKKVRFCRQAAAELGLANVRVSEGRAESLGGAARDTVVSRAAFDLAGLWRLAEPLLAAGGRVVAMKGRRPDAELAGLAGAPVEVQVVPLPVPGLTGARHLVLMTRAPGG
jgi:16S rRNA (guanine527-N7)-methyltransferase